MGRFNKKQSELIDELCKMRTIVDCLDFCLKKQEHMVFLAEGVANKSRAEQDMAPFVLYRQSIEEQIENNIREIMNEDGEG